MKLKRNFKKRKSYKPLKRNFKRLRTKYSQKKNAVPRRMVSSGMGFAKKMMMTHKYVQSFNLSSTTGSFNTYNWCANGMFDPNLTGSGHQPMYFDQMTALYDHYVVIGSKIKITIPANEYNMVYGIMLNDDTTTTPTAFDGAIEETQSTYRVINAVNTTPAVFRYKWGAKKVFGGSVLNNANLQGTSAANPSEISVYTMFAQPLNKADSTGNYSALVEIEYIAIWTELKDIGQS